MTLDTNPPKTWVVVPYRAEWPELFAREAELLGRIFAETGALIEHIGSTAVPGLGAKPIIDIMIGLSDPGTAEARVTPLAEASYEYVPEYESKLPERRYFRKPLVRPRTHHLHIVELHSDFWKKHLLFRDYLRAHPDVAHEYDQLKQQLAHESASTGVYTERKTPFITRVLELASR